jgi:hypothetical protein
MDFSIHLFVKHFWKHLFLPNILNVSTITLYEEESEESDNYDTDID